jgi:hypothetical protein
VGSFPTFAALFLIFELAAPVLISVAFVALRNLELGDVPVCMVVAAVCIHSKPDDSVCYLYIIDEDNQGLVCFCWVRLYLSSQWGKLDYLFLQECIFCFDLCYDSVLVCQGGIDFFF